MFKFF